MMSQGQLHQDSIRTEYDEDIFNSQAYKQSRCNDNPSLSKENIYAHKLELLIKDHTLTIKNKRPTI